MVKKKKLKKKHPKRGALETTKTVVIGSFKSPTVTLVPSSASVGFYLLTN